MTLDEAKEIWSKFPDLHTYISEQEVNGSDETYVTYQGINMNRKRLLSLSALGVHHRFLALLKTGRPEIIDTNDYTVVSFTGACNINYTSNYLNDELCQELLNYGHLADLFPVLADEVSLLMWLAERKVVNPNRFKEVL